jgi:hypothetical protein
LPPSGLTFGIRYKPRIRLTTNNASQPPSAGLVSKPVWIRAGEEEDQEERKAVADPGAEARHDPVWHRRTL